MRRLSLLAPLCVALIAASVQAQPVITLSSNALDFAPTLVGVESTLPLTIQNTGDQTLDVADVVITGDAFVSDFDGAFSIDPGAESGLTVSFWPPVTGAFQETLTISSNDPGAPESVVTLRGDGIAPEISVSPAELDFGVLSEGETRELPVTITNVGSADLTITDTWIDGLYYTDFAEVFVLAPNESREVSVLFNPDRLGEFGGAFNISSDDVDEDYIQLPLRGVVNGAFSFVGGLTTEGGAVRVAVSGNFAYVADQASGLAIVDISNPADPTLAGNFNTDGTAYDVAVSGNYAYVADGLGLRILDVSDPANPSSVGFYDSPGIAYGVAVAGNYAYLADGLSGLHVVNVSDPANPARTGTYNTPGEARDVAVSGSYAYVADRSRGLQIINVTNPAAPTRTGYYDTPGECFDVALAGSNAYVADGGQGLSVISIANPASPSRIGSALQGGTTYGVDVATARVFLSTDGIGLKVFDVSTPSSPTEIASFATIALCGRDVFVLGEYAYVADGGGGLRILDIYDVLPHPDIDALMANLDFGEIQVGQTATLGLDISNVGNFPLNLTNIAIAGDYFSSDFAGSVEIPVGSSQHYTITFAPGSVGDHIATISLSSDDPDEPQVDLEVRGAGAVNHDPNVANQIADLTQNEDSGPTTVADLDAVFADADGDALTFSFTGAPGPLNMSINEENALNFEADLNYNLPNGVQITITATDPRGGSVSDQFTLVITPVNDDPQLNLPIEDITVDEDSELNIAAFLNESFGDVDGDLLTFTYAGDPVPLRMGTRLFLGERILFFQSDLNYNLAEGVGITVTATDPSGRSVNDVFRVVVTPVNDAPTVAQPIVDQTVNEDTGTIVVGDLDNIFNDVDVEQLSYQVAGQADLNLLIGEDNRLSFTPDANFNIPDGAVITVTARDGFDVTVSDVFTIRVAPVNDAPLVSNGIVDVLVDEDPGQISVADLRNIFSDVENDALTYSIADAPGDLNMLVVNGYDLVFNPDLNFDLSEGVDITITAQDPSGASVSDQFNLAITPVNDPPFASSPIPDQDFNEDQGLTVVANLGNVFTDPDGDQLIFSILGAPEEIHASIAEDNALSFSCDADYNLANGIELTVTAEDPSGLTGSQTFVLVINPVNDAPVVEAPIVDITIDEDAGLTNVADLNQVFGDTDGDNLNFSISGAPATLGLSIDGFSNLTIDTDPDFNLSEGVEVTIVAEDGGGLSTQTTFRVTVNPVNDAPFVDAPIGDLTVNEDAGLTIVVDLDDVFADVDLDNLTFGFSGAPAGLNMSLDGENVLAFNPDLNYNLPGGAEITVTASDGALGAVERFVVTVTPINDSPVVVQDIGDVTVDEDPGQVVVVDLDDVFFDLDGDAVAFNFFGAPAELNLGIDGDHVLSFNPDLDFNLPDGATVTVTATDGGGLAAEEPFTIVVTPVNDAPVVVNPVGTVTLNEDPGFVVIADLNYIFADIDRDALSFSFTGGDEELHLNLDGNGQLFVNPDADFNAAGGIAVTLTAQDPSGLNVSDQITIVIEPVNDAPTLVQAIADVVINEDSAPVVIADLDNNFSDPDGDALSFSFTGAPVGLNMYVDGSHVLSITPNPNFNIPDGTEITVTASDGGDLSVSEVFNITINPMNDAPVVHLPINDFAVNEDSPIVNIADLDNTFRDVDGDALSYSFSGAPDEFNMTITGENILTFTPDLNFNIPAGAQIVVTASDEFVTVEETFIVTIIPINDRPVTVNPILDVTVNEDAGVTVVGDLDDVFNDIDGDALTFDFTGAPAELNMSLDGDNILSFNSDANYNLPEGAAIIVTANDGALAVEEGFTVTINPVNDQPEIVQAIADVTVDEDPGLVVVADLADVFFDLDGDALTYTFSGAPAELNLNLDGDNLLSINPNANFNLPDGAEIVVTAGDGDLTVQDAFIVVINPINDGPVLEFIADQTIQEGSALTFGVSGSDPDNQSLTYSATDLPEGASFENQVFNWTPGYNLAGIYEVTFTVSDGELSDNQLVTITVTNTNRAPELAFISNQNIAEGAPLSFSVSGSDPDGQSLFFGASGLPEGATFENQEFNWTPGYDMAGSYDVTFTVTDGDLLDDQVATITVTNTNRAPELAFIEDKTIAEGSLLSFAVSASDPDGQFLTYEAIGIPEGASFENQEFNWTPGYNVTGVYEVTFTVSDGELSDNQLVTITVTNTNRPPELAFIDNQSVAENARLAFNVSGSDPDEQFLTYSSSELPEGATFEDQQFIWTPGYDMAGTYEVTFTVSDGDLSDNQFVTITVANTNRAPEVGFIDDKTVAEGSSLYFNVSGSDPDGDALSYEVSSLPAGATFVDQDFNWTPEYDMAGSYDVTFVVTDGDLTDDQFVTITVTNTNRAPELGFIGEQSVEEGTQLRFGVSGSDPDGDALTYVNSAMPEGATFAGGEFVWSPGFDQSGEYYITFTVTDNGEPNLSDEETVTITVGNTNRPPVLGVIGNQSVDENSALAFSLTASDPDGNNLTFSADGLPEGATLDGANFVWTPDYNQASDFEVTFRVVDDGTPNLADEVIVTITVTNVNRPPILATIGNQVTAEGSALNIALSASDPDNDNLIFSAIDLPAGSSFADANFTWTPGYGQAGSYDVTFRVADDSEPSMSDEETVTITVDNTNRAPVLYEIGNQSVFEGALVTFNVVSVDPDNNALVCATSELPAGATFSNWEFSWTPDYSQAGTYPVTFTVTDDGEPNLSDEETITITVVNVNRPPVLTEINDQIVDEGALLSFELAAEDPDQDPLTFGIVDAPDGAALEGSRFSWTPTFEQAGEYQVIFTVSDDGAPALTDADTLLITVYDVNRAPVMVVPIEDMEFAEDCGEVFIADLNQVFTDPDGDPLTFTANGEPNLNLNITEDALLIINPNPNYNGVSDVTVIASDGAGEGRMGAIFNFRTFPVIKDQSARSVRSLATKQIGRDSETDGIFTVTILPVNDAPIWTVIPTEPIEVVNGEELVVAITIEDIDGDQISLACGREGLPEAAVFEDRGDGTGQLTWTPLLRDVGRYEISFTGSDGVATISTTVIIDVTGELHHFTNYIRTAAGHNLRTTAISLEGTPVPTSWEVGAFTPAGLLGGAMVWFDDGQAHDFIAWQSQGEDQQFNDGDALNFRVWDGSAQIEYAATPTFTEGPSVWSANALTVFSLELVNVRSQQISFLTGWNLISLNITPDHSFWTGDQGPDVRLMTENLRTDPENPNSAHHIVLMKNQRGQFYTPEFNYNSIPYWSATEGYLVKVDANVNGSWSGAPIAPDASIPIKTGWNIVAYYPTYELTCTRPSFEAISSIIESVEIVKDGTGRFAVPSSNYSNMPPWREGRGYFINATADVTLNYPVAAGGAAAMPCEEKTLSSGPWIEPISTGLNMSVLLTGIVGVELQNGDLVGAFNSSGRLVGLGRAHAGLTGLPVWGDDPTTDGIDGMIEGETIQLRHWSSTSQKITILHSQTVEKGAGLTYTTDGFTAMTAAPAAIVPDTYYLSGAYPNPFNGVTRIAFGLPEAARVSIRVFDVTGREVVTLVSSELQAGHHMVTWNAEEFNSGVYLVKMETGGFTSAQKMMLVK